MWKEFANNYEVSSDGSVRNKRTGLILKPDLNSKGYYRITANGKRYFIHRLVALLFVPNPNNYTQVNHIDHNRLNNNVDNLEWCSNQYNNQHGYSHGRTSGHTKLSVEEVNDIIKHIDSKDVSCKELASLYNVAIPTIYAIKQGLNIKRLDLK